MVGIQDHEGFTRLKCYSRKDSNFNDNRFFSSLTGFNICLVNSIKEIRMERKKKIQVRAPTRFNQLNAATNELIEETTGSTIAL
jgi:hypothetical protein